MNWLYPILLLIVSNMFMTCAWYGHLKLQQMHVVTDSTPLFLIILLSWGIAFIEYCFLVPANRMGFAGNGGSYSLVQLKVIQEVISITVFALFTLLVFQNESFRWNHLAAFCCLVLAVYFVFMK